MSTATPVWGPTIHNLSPASYRTGAGTTAAERRVGCVATKIGKRVALCPSPSDLGVLHVVGLRARGPGAAPDGRARVTSRRDHDKGA
jgi:hypothetical protein